MLSWCRDRIINDITPTTAISITVIRKISNYLLCIRHNLLVCALSTPSPSSFTEDLLHCFGSILVALEVLVQRHINLDLRDALIRLKFPAEARSADIRLILQDLL